MARGPLFVACLLLMLAGLMAAHLGVLWLGAWECDEYAQILLSQIEAGDRDRITADNSECSEIETNFTDAAGQYIAVILALLGGAGVTAGHGRRRNGTPEE